MNKNILLLGLTILLFFSCNKSDTEKTITPENPAAETPNSGNNNGDNNTPQPTSKSFVHKQLLEYITGTWCSYCPSANEGVKQVKANKEFAEKSAIVAIHGAKKYNDPMALSAINDKLFPYMSSLPSNNFTGGFPFTTINRWSRFYYTNVGTFFDKIREEPTADVGIKIESNLNQTGGDVSVSFRFNKDYKELKYSIFITEDGFVSPQYTKQGYIQNYVHDNVLIAASGEVTGNLLGDVQAGKEITKNNQKVSYKLRTNNLSNVKVVVFVANNEGLVLNSQVADANKKVDYQYSE